MTDKKQLAQHLYMTQGMTQKQVALEVGVSERTIYAWIHQYGWDKLKQAAYQAPATITENLCCQLIELQNAIARREPGCRYPDQKEAEVIRKLVLSIETMKKYPSLSQNMQMMETFRNYVRPLNTQFTKQLAHYADRFLTEKSVGGFAPYQMEYGIEQLAPVASYYDELDGDEPCDKTNPPGYPVPCKHMNECLHPGNCNYPKCKRETLFDDDPQTETTPEPARNKVEEENTCETPPREERSNLEMHVITPPSPSERVGVRPLSGGGVRLPSAPTKKPEATGSNSAILTSETTENKTTQATREVRTMPG